MPDIQSLFKDASPNTRWSTPHVQRYSGWFQNVFCPASSQ